MPETVPPPTKPDVEPRPADPAPKPAPQTSPFEPDWPGDRPLPQPKGDIAEKWVSRGRVGYGMQKLLRLL